MGVLKSLSNYRKRVLATSKPGNLQKHRSFEKILVHEEVSTQKRVFQLLLM